MKLLVRGQRIWTLAESNWPEGNLIVPNSNVNNDGKPNLNRNNVRNDNNARVALGYKLS